MKRTLTLLFSVGVGVSVFILGLNKHAVLSVVPTAQAAEGCSVATLQGNYILTGRGDFAPRGSEDPTTYPRVQVGVWSFDGKGTYSAAFTASLGGDISRTAGPGTYTLNDDCTGTIIAGGGTVNFEIVVTRDGREGEYIRVDQGFVTRFSIRKQ